MNNNRKKWLRYGLGILMASGCVLGWTAAVSAHAADRPATAVVQQVKLMPVAAENDVDVDSLPVTVSMNAGEAIVRSLQQKGTPAGNYRVSAVDADIVLDAAALTVGPADK